MQLQTAAAFAEDTAARVRDDPTGRLAVMRALYRGGPFQRHLPFRAATNAFMSWQLQRQLLNPPHMTPAGSPWWRAVNERLIRDGYEARALVAGYHPAGSTPSVQAAVEFVRHPTARAWYRAHNASIVSAYLEHEELARAESRVERYFINLVLIRVLFAHALVSAPRLALGWLGPAAPLLGDPRIGMTGIFMSMSRILPDRYPLGQDIEPYIAIENRFGHLLDFGLVTPRLARLYRWSAAELQQPGLLDLLDGDIPTYAWPAADAAPWDPAPSSLARLARRALP